MGFIFLSSLNCFLESNKFCIGPTEFMESSSESCSHVSIVPRLYFVFVDFYSFLITLSPAIEMSIGAQPSGIFSENWIRLEFFFCSGIEEICSKSELVFAISWWSTEWVIASSKIPESLLISSTSIATYDGEWYIEFRLKSFGHFPETVSGIFSEKTISSGLIYECSRYGHEIRWCIGSFWEGSSATDKSQVTRIVIKNWKPNRRLESKNIRSPILRSGFSCSCKVYSIKQDG